MKVLALTAIAAAVLVSGCATKQTSGTVSPEKLESEHMMVQEATLGKEPSAMISSEGKQGQLIDYTVKKGDTLTKIAKTFKVSVHDVVSANSITDKNKIKAGQVIKIPQ